MRCGAAGALLGLVVLSVAGGEAAAQRAKQADQRCRLQLVRARRQGTRVETAPGVVNYFIGGDVHMRCIGEKVEMFADSVAVFGEHVAQFIGHVRYRDSVTAMDSDFGQDNKVSNDEYFDAQGNVKHRDLRAGSSIDGPRIIYYRPREGVRPDGEVTADQRPTVKYVLEDSAGRSPEPYVIVGDRVKLRGSELIESWGRVTVDRSDLQARGDTLWIDSGSRSAGRISGGRDSSATLRGVGRDSFDLAGRVIDLKLRDKELVGLLARRSARLVGKDVTLEADSIRLDLADGEAERTTAWGASQRPRAVSADYEVTGDSLVVESPERRLRSLRTYGGGWMGLRADSADGQRDWIAGQAVMVTFVDRDSAGTTTSAVKEIRAERQARVYYRIAPEVATGRASINYTRADTILVTMRVTADSTKVERVDARGNVDGVHLQPAVARADSAARDTTAARPRPPERGRAQ
jgi:hypothetical protein